MRSRMFLFVCWFGAALSARSAPNLDLVALTKGGGESIGCGWRGALASDGGDFVFLSGDSTGPGCRDGTMWSRFIESDGGTITAMEQQTGGKGEYSRPRLATMNGRTGMVATVAYDEDEAVVRIPQRWGGDEYSSYGLQSVSGAGKPLAMAWLNNGAIAMIHEDSVEVVIYVKNSVLGSWPADSYVKRKRLSLSPMKKVKTLVYDAKVSALFVGGNVSGGKRGIARVDMDDYTPSLAWVSSVDTDVGTPQLHLRRKSVKSEATEVLLLSRSFYARVDASNGEQLYLKVQSGDKYMSWLPEGEAAQAVYDTTQDVLYSTADTTLRQHDVESGDVVWDLEFYDDPPKSWDIKLKDTIYTHNNKDYPPYCGNENYPDHPEVREGKWKDVNSRNADEICSTNSKCPYKDERRGPSDKLLSCDNDELCCIDDDCCVLDSHFFHWWFKHGGSPNSNAVYATADGNVHVIITDSGYRTDGEDDEDYYDMWLVTFSSDGGVDSNQDTQAKCDQVDNKPECRAAITPTGCYWKRSTETCVKANKCTKIKKNERACMEATEHDCAYVMKKENKYGCVDYEKRCKVAKTKTACKSNEGCSWVAPGYCRDGG